MLDLELAAALFRAIGWQQVRRLILVGDAGQLPPIGRGRVFADFLKWLAREHPQNLGRLKHNLRQLLNKVEGNGSAMMALSELFIVDDEDKSEGETDTATRADQEKLIEKIHAGGAVDRDLDVIYWDDPARLAAMLIEAIEAKMTGGRAAADTPPHLVWRGRLKGDPTAFQILTPHRGELHGVEALNEACQSRIAANLISKIGAVDGIIR
jgi:ATP-dependent exoDNAse (exonuclease V) alpha subunit